MLHLVNIKDIDSSIKAPSIEGRAIRGQGKGRQVLVLTLKEAREREREREAIEYTYHSAAQHM